MVIMSSTVQAGWHIDKDDDSIDNVSIGSTFSNNQKENLLKNDQNSRLYNNLKKKADQENLLTAVQSDITSLQNKIQAEKKNELENNKERIIDLIEKEISSRYYFQKGKIMMSLKNDIEIKEAVKVLNDSGKYKKILNGK